MLKSFAVSVGNEVDAYFASHPDEIEQYATFFQQVAKHIREALPAAKVGCKMTFPGRTGELRDHSIPSTHTLMRSC